VQKYQETASIFKWQLSSKILIFTADVFPSLTLPINYSPPHLARRLCRTTVGHSPRNIKALTRTCVRVGKAKIGFPPLEIDILVRTEPAYAL
jgi:hypothetical protein